MPPELSSEQRLALEAKAAALCAALGLAPRLDNDARVSLGLEPVPAWLPADNEDVGDELTDAQRSAARACAVTGAVFAAQGSKGYDREPPRSDEHVIVRRFQLRGALPSQASVMLGPVRARGTTRAAGSSRTVRRV